jgi:hypothetical protein
LFRKYTIWQSWFQERDEDEKNEQFFLFFLPAGFLLKLGTVATEPFFYWRSVATKRFFIYKCVNQQKTLTNRTRNNELVLMKQTMFGFYLTENRARKTASSLQQSR